MRNGFHRGTRYKACDEDFDLLYDYLEEVDVKSLKKLEGLGSCKNKIIFDDVTGGIKKFQVKLLDEDEIPPFSRKKLFKDVDIIQLWGYSFVVRPTDDKLLLPVRIDKACKLADERLDSEGIFIIQPTCKEGDEESVDHHLVVPRPDETFYQAVPLGPVAVHPEDVSDGLLSTEEPVRLVNKADIDAVEHVFESIKKQYESWLENTVTRLNFPNFNSLPQVFDPGATYESLSPYPTSPDDPRARLDERVTQYVVEKELDSPRRCIECNSATEAVRTIRTTKSATGLLGMLGKRDKIEYDACPSCPEFTALSQEEFDSQLERSMSASKAEVDMYKDELKGSVRPAPLWECLSVALSTETLDELGLLTPAEYERIHTPALDEPAPA